MILSDKEIPSTRISKISEVTGPHKRKSFFLTCLVIAALSFPNLAASGVIISPSYDEQKCFTGHNVFIPVSISNEAMISNLQAAKEKMRPQFFATADAESAEQAISQMNHAVCTAEYHKNVINVDDLISADELPTLLAALQSILDLDLREDFIDITAGLIVLFTARLSDLVPYSALLERAIHIKLKNAVKGNNEESLTSLLDALVGHFLSRDSNANANAVDFLQEIERLFAPVTIDELSSVSTLAVQHALYSFVAKFPLPAGIDNHECHMRRIGNARALLVGIEHYEHAEKYPDLKGVRNDVDFLRKTFESQGVEDIRIAVDVNRGHLLDKLRDLVSATRCGDSVLFHFSGISDWLQTGGSRCRGDGCFLKGWNLGLFLTDGDERTGSGIFYGAELSEFITAIRNRGANVSVILDTNYAAALDIYALQDLATPQSISHSGRLKVPDTRSDSDAELGAITAIRQDAGEYIVFYAADRGDEAFEIELSISETESRIFGAFTYAFAQALQTIKNPTGRELFMAIDGEYANVLGRKDRGVRYPQDLPKPVLDASDADLPILPSVTADQPITLDIELLSPTVTRGNLIVTSRKFEIIGRLNNHERFANLTADLEPIEVSANGQFSHKVALQPGKRSIQFAAIDYDYRFHTKSFELELPDDLQPLATQGKRYALIVGNQNYDHHHFRDLRTPHHDAKTIGRLLAERYGFETTIVSPVGEKVDLIMLDAKQRPIYTTLRILKNQLTEQDTLVVYYAGHGIYQDDIDRAYWLPVDAEPEANYTWIKSTDLTDTLRQFTARNILVVADSCYSGAMAKRDVPQLKTLDEDRRKALFKAATRQSRILISSGGTEPVLDEGGQDHSVFARAVITALENMDEEVFSSQEIYSQFIYPMVQGREHQEPQHKELEQSGHEGGDVIFFRNTAESRQ